MVRLLRSVGIAVGLAASLLFATTSGRADEESEAEKLAREEGEEGEEDVGQPAALPPAAQSDLAAAVAPYREMLESLAQWCSGLELYLDRARAAEVLLLADPDHDKAHGWLGHKRQKDGSWRPGNWRNPVNAVVGAASLAQLDKRRAEVAEPLRARLEPLLARPVTDQSAPVVARVVRVLVNLFPADAALRERNGEVNVKGKWLLRESVETKAGRQRIAKAAEEALAEAETVTKVRPQGVGEGWSYVREVSGALFLSMLSDDDVDAVVERCVAARGFYRRVFGVNATFRENLVVYVLGGDAENERFLDRVKGFDPAVISRSRNFGTYWLGQSLVVARSHVPSRVDSVVRQTLSSLNGPLEELTSVPDFLSEGIGMYLTWRLVGTRLTAFISVGEYYDESLSREVADVSSDWVVVARKLTDKGLALDLPMRVGLPMNSLSKDDGLIAYALAAYMLESRPKETVALLAALEDDGTDVHTAIARAFRVDAEGLQYRFLRWLHEIPAK